MGTYWSRPPFEGKMGAGNRQNIQIILSKERFTMPKLSVNRYLDAAILKPELPETDVVKALEQCVAYEIKSVCVRPGDIELALQVCRGTATEVGCVLNFPHGAGLSTVKAFEAKQYLNLGVAEIDMVVNYSFIKSGRWDRVEDDITAVTRLTQPAGVVLKVILETAMLSLDEISRATTVAAQAGADFVKTSTGFNGEGATVEAVQTMLEAAGDRIKVKASGGIRNLEQAKLFLEMGCQRLGVNYTSVSAICDPLLADEVQTSGY
jgi:deoxyribose-phosphate aldolase